MIKSIRALFLSLTILSVLLFSAFRTTVVRADGEDEPAAAAPTTGTETGTEDGTGTSPDAAARVFPPSSEPTPAAGDAGETSDPKARPPATEVSVEAASRQPILDQVPENTTVTVIGSDGEALSLASQESAEVIASDADPIWCPASQTTPTPGMNGCTESFPSFDELLSFLLDNETNPAYQKAGTIFVEQGSYSGGESSIDFNDFSFASFNQYDLTLQGGWDTSDNSLDGTSLFDVPLVIGSALNLWGGSLSLNNLSIGGISDGAGLTLYTEGDIALSNVEVTDSQSGADLNAGGDVAVSDSDFSSNDQGGARITSGGNVTVTNSRFNSNGSSSANNPTGSGLSVDSGGTVTLASIEANHNQLFGVDIQAVGNVNVTSSFFSGNQGYEYVRGVGWQYEGYGLQVITGGGIDLDGVTANDNFLFGASLTGAKVEVSNSFFSENASDWAEHVTGSGLKVVSGGAVTLASVTASDNQLFGADIQAPGAVTITDSFFNGNTAYTYCNNEKIYYGYGLRVITQSEVFLGNVEAQENYLYGAHIEGKDIAIDTGRFSNNGSGNGLDLTGRGLEIISQFEVALANVTANNNQLFGADIVAGDLVAIEQSYFNGHIAYVYDHFTHKVLSRDGGYGLRVVTEGNIALEDVTADNNYLYGAYLQGDDVAVEGVLGVSSFSGNGSGVLSQPPGDGFGYGLKIVSTGAVNLFNINTAASAGNQFFGADITAAQDVTIVNAFFSGNQSVTLDPCGSELSFYGYGLTVTTPADISLDGVVANFNNLWGASLTGNDVLIANSQFNNNISDSNIFIDDTGLIVNASGIVDLYKVEAKENRLIGATITTQGDVFIAESTFTDNRGFTCLYDWCPEGSITYHGYGLQVTTPGLIQVTGTTASGNNLFGAELNGGVVNVIDSTFSNNVFGNGLTVNATGNVTLTNVTAVNNGDNGVEVTGACTNVVNVNGGTFTDNDEFGLAVARATLILDGTQIFANNGLGDTFTDTTCVVAPVAPAGNAASSQNVLGGFVSTSVYSRNVFVNNTGLVIPVTSAWNQFTALNSTSAIGAIGGGTAANIMNVWERAAVSGSHGRGR